MDGCTRRWARTNRSGATEMSRHALRLQWFVPSPLAVVADAWQLAAGVALQAERNPSSDAQFEALAAGRVDAVVTAMDALGQLGFTRLSIAIAQAQASGAK